MRNILAVLLLMPLYAFGGQTVFYFNSTPGDYIGQGQEMIITPEDPSDFFISRNYYDGVTFRVDNYPYISNYSERNWWYVDFTAPYRAPLTVGNYEGATRHPFQEFTEPGLSMSGNHRGCNRLSGRFDILEIEYDSSGENIIKFAADFEQRCETIMPPLYGSIRYNSDVPLAAFVPGQIELQNSLNSENCIEAVDSSGTLAEFIGSTVQEGLLLDWSTSTGETGSGEYFAFQVEVGATEVVTLTSTDQDENTKSTTRSICVSDTTPPIVQILSPTEGEMFVGNNMRLEVQVTDSVDRNISDYEVFVGNTFNGQLRDGYSSIKLSKDVESDMIDTGITVKASDSSGNVASETVHVFKKHDMRK